MLAPQHKSVEKPWQRVWLVRTIFCLTIVGMVAAGCLAIAAALLRNNVLFMAGWLTALPCILFNVLTSFSYSIFGFNYSWLGFLQLSKAPSDWQPVVSRSSGIRIPGRYRGFASFQFGPGGVLIWIPPFTPVFIGSDQITAFADDSWVDARLDHTSPEIGGPIYVWRSVALEMEKCMPELSLVRS
jgi:hypothetical protein